MRLPERALHLAAIFAATATVWVTASAAVVTQGSYFETHMSQQLGVTEHRELHRRLHEAASKAQADAEAVAASGQGTSEYLQWRRRLAAATAGRSRRGRQLEIVSGTSGTASLVPPPLNSPPGPGDVNITCIRHGSVRAPSLVDWRIASAVNTPVFDQRACESCWLWAAADIISMKWSLLSHFLTPVPVSPQHVCDCGYKKCCSGGWPEWTFLFAKVNKGVAPLSSYPYQAKDNQKCLAVNASLLTGKITGWEKLPASNPVALIKTVSMHPVVVLIYASPSFLQYRGGIWTGSDCPTRSTVNHALVVMGFNASDPIPYWIAKNSWGTGWGEGGYVRIAMVSRICGFGSEPSLYPTMYHVKTPCDAVPSPCGNGTCYLMSDQVTARCQCPAGFVERLEDNAPKCVTATPCTAAINPCAFGACSNEFDGSYTCWCPPGTAVGTRADGAETCIVNTFQSGLLTTTTVDGDTCASIGDGYNLTLSALLTMNPFLNCTSIGPGTVLVVGGAGKGLGCGMTDVVGPGDTCAAIAQRSNITVAQLQAINPSLACPSLLLSQHICVLPGQFATTSPYERSCGASYTTDFDDSCLSIVANYSMSLALLQWLNPGLDCTATSIGMTSVCVAPLTFSASLVACYDYYNITQGDTCFTVAASSGLNVDDFFTLNPGLRCTWPFWVIGMSVCINGTYSPPEATPVPPNLLPYYVKTNDTLLKIATYYSSRCLLSNGTAGTPAAFMVDMCWANGWYPICNDRNVVVGSLIMVPCLSNVGADSCKPSTSITQLIFSLSFVCGTDGRTYTSSSCAAKQFAMVQSYGACTYCTWACIGIGSQVPNVFWGTTLPGNCVEYNQACPWVTPDTATWSQLCSKPCQFMRQVCSSQTFALGTSGCKAFASCLSRGTTFLSYSYPSSTSCPYTQQACGQTYDMSICSI